MRLCFQPAQPGAERIAERAIGHVRSRRARALSLDMVVMAFLHRAHLGLDHLEKLACAGQLAHLGRRSGHGLKSLIGRSEHGERAFTTQSIFKPCFLGLNIGNRQTKVAHRLQ